MNKVKLVVFLILAALLTSCGAATADVEADRTSPESDVITDAVRAEPKNSGEMFDFVIDTWKKGECETLYAYATDDLAALFDAEAFGDMFEKITDTFGKINEVSKPEVTAENGFDVYSASLSLDNADVAVTLSLRGAQIGGFVRDIRFKGEFETEHDGICQRYFLLNGLNAVYTCAANGGSAPAVLMISGSGPCDYNETVGTLEPLADIAAKLAERGISSLRFEKRTFRFTKDFKSTDGIETEYLEDCRAALSYLRSLEKTDGVYLLGHSLAGSAMV